MRNDGFHMLCLTAQEAWPYQLAEGYVKQAIGWVNISWADAQLDWFSDTNKFQKGPGKHQQRQPQLPTRLRTRGFVRGSGELQMLGCRAGTPGSRTLARLPFGYSRHRVAVDQPPAVTKIEEGTPWMT